MQEDYIFISFLYFLFGHVFNLDKTNNIFPTKFLKLLFQT